MFYCIEQQRHNNNHNNIIKYLSMLVLVLGPFNNIAFPHDLTSRPGFATGNMKTSVMIFMKSDIGEFY
jgi:hypothetical protein